MAQFVVLEPTGAEAFSGKTGAGSPSEKAVFVHNGFSILALVFPFVWLLMQRLWFEAFAVLGITILLGLAGTYLGIDDAVPLLAILVSLFVALEGVGWKIAKLERQGYVQRAVIEAADLDEAEIRYFIGRDGVETASADIPVPQWGQQVPRPAPSTFGATIGFVGHRGEN
ncbi:DUF2628 domain-containing protein [Brucella inopinata]|uniref:DUF2628 domain-containing protein n=1 Tax=Brucella inopinata TaxID=1218315 RepID=A0AAW7AX38_9HYPH|nr:DUF2628 domain-containing protein [Brucella inopinata]EFM57892.1 Hypothetical protein BIBO1_0154 [Brucella inopinata BO1]KEY04289.1 hypothetical protein IL59_0210920 [Brucella suis bv. 4 str. 40]MDL2331533.1 DUF2628 domain-containing protein [Brucella inopinata]